MDLYVNALTEGQGLVRGSMFRRFDVALSRARAECNLLGLSVASFLIFLATWSVLARNATFVATPMERILCLRALETPPCPIALDKTTYG